MVKTPALPFVLFFTFLFIVPAIADDSIVFPPVPAGSVSPVLQWIMGVTTTILGLALPLGLLWVKQYLGIRSTQARQEMIQGAVERAAHLADLEMHQQGLTMEDTDPTSPVVTKAVQRVIDGLPASVITATSEATSDHLADSVTAELHKITQARSDAAAPTVVLAPVSKQVSP